ncbi:hypothetical protein EUTSA_v10023879mg [Eutrema salsugineum]|uniref:Protease Do-like PDZ domain-containing protein n=1 Tax=Eutrema salsugineum TaxID=72664 RepID=V4JU78_EUTSA|nr:hypothetical protein EUTSA_v10023879mg [Eutrema salsugineum]
MVKVFAATTRHDSYRPWQNRETEEGTGSNNSTTIYKAKVTKISHECDLAILEVANEDFWEGMSALYFTADIPLVGEAVTVLGFPKGYESQVSKSGLVIGIQFKHYTHSQTEHLVILVDAHIISGHSGGPVVVQGKVIGVAFQSFDFDKVQVYISSVIPTCLVMQFLSSTEESQQLSALSSLGLTFTLNSKETGVVIDRISSLSGAHKIMYPFDIMLAIDNIAIGSDGRVPFRRDERIDFRYLVSLKKPCESLLIKFLRSGEVHECVVTLKPYNRPKYYIFGGLVFVPFSQSYMDDFVDQLPRDALFKTTVSEAKELEAGELVMLSRVYKVNGVKVKSLKHLVEIIEQCCMEYLTLDLQNGEVAEVHYTTAKEATSEIMEVYRIFYSKSKML